MQELKRLNQLPAQTELDKDFQGQTYHVIVHIDLYEFRMAVDTSGLPYSILKITGTIDATPLADPGATPIELPLDADLKLTVILIPGAGVPVVGFRYDGVDGTPSFPVAAADIDTFIRQPQILDLINGIQIAIAEDLIDGVSASLFPDPGTRPVPADWSVALTLTPASSDTVDAFVISTAPPGIDASLNITESHMAANMGISIAFNRTFLDPLISASAAAKVGTKTDGVITVSLEMIMADTGISIDGHVVRPVKVLPDVDVYFNGIAIPRLIRGTTSMTMDTSGINVDVDDSDEVFYFILKWFLTLGAMALLFTGVGSLTFLGIALWASVVQFAWKGAAQLDDAPHILRDSLGDALAGPLSKLADSLGNDYPAGSLVVDATPDSCIVVNGHIILYAQVIISQIMSRMRSAEYSHHLRRFVIFELNNRRRFRAQELARLMQKGKIIVPGFHQVDGDYIRSDHDDSEANNMLEMFKSNETKEVVVRNR